MARCPAGHESVAADYCDVCGMLMDAPAPPSDAAPAGDSSDRGHFTVGSAAAASSCPRCGAPGLGRFCEVCGFSAIGGATAQPVTSWTAVVSASRPYYDTVIASGGPDGADVPFLDSSEERRFALSGTQMRIGRRSISREITPEIDLSGPPADPGISRLHAILVVQSDGSWAVVDPGSENGTTVNGGQIPAGQPVPLGHGDGICLGVWTLITIEAQTPRQGDG
jgi:hypothetical protein